MKENLLHFIWQNAAFCHQELQSTCGADIVIHRRGIYNTDSGPDFSNAEISIGGLRWVGNVEIHIATSNWFEHGHQSDRAYDNTILHVVYQHDMEAPVINGSPLATLELKNRFDPLLFEKAEIFNNPADIPCSVLLKKQRLTNYSGMLGHFAELRLHHKNLKVVKLLEETRNNWDAVFHVLQASYFGLFINRLPFEMLARSIQTRILIRHSQELFDMEALLLGQSGLLHSTFRDEYPRKLQERYEYLRHKYSLVPVDVSLWKLMRMRPANFPALRIAQLAALLHRQAASFSSIRDIESSAEGRNAFQANASEYWKTHYRFDERTSPHSTRIGSTAVDLLIINVLVPLLYSYGLQRQQPQITIRARNILKAIPPEQNRISKAFGPLGIKAVNAYESQALSELKKNFCEKRRCLSCGIGIELFQRVI